MSGRRAVGLHGKLLALTVSTRITDRSNVPPGPNGVPGTGNTHFPIPLDCTATASTSTGSTCNVSTTADALMPGAVTEGRRAIWELGRVQVRDAGPNGTGFEVPRARRPAETATRRCS